MTATRVGIGLTATALAGGVAAAIKRDSTRTIDRAVRRRIHPRRSPRVTAVAKGVSFLAGPHIHPAVAALLGFMLRIERGRAGYGPSAASVGAWGIDNAARIFVHQKRPPKAGPHHSRYRYAYPSGHTTAATAIGVATASAIADDPTQASTGTKAMDRVPDHAHCSNPRAARIVWRANCSRACEERYSRCRRVVPGAIPVSPGAAAASDRPESLDPAPRHDHSFF